MPEFTHRLPHQPWQKPSRNEEEYFHRLEFQQRMELARAREARRRAEERRRLLEVHKDHCPKCGSRLEPLQTVEGRADQCPHCLGVWLDREMFDRLTHPEEERRSDVLAGILREMMLQYTTGRTRPPESGA